MLNKYERMSRIDPYESCPCGSEMKFKFCCYPKAKEAKAAQRKNNEFAEYTDQRINHVIQTKWKETDFKTCLGFDKENCKPLIKSAHAIQNNRILNRISENGHVYTFQPKASMTEITTELQKISKNKASTFFGFCEYHDTEIFKPIELESFIGTPLQIYLFAFRGFCLEYHRKFRKMKTFRASVIERPEILLNPDTVHFYRIAELDLIDSEYEYKIFNEDFSAKAFDNLITLSFQLDYEVEIAVSSAFAVHKDCYGNVINEIYSLEPSTIPSVYFNIFPEDNKTHILLSYHKSQQHIYGDFFNQIETLSMDQLKKLLNFLMINYTENIFFSPRLIDSMSAEKQDILLKSFTSSVFIGIGIELILNDKYFDFDILTDSRKQKEA